MAFCDLEFLDFVTLYIVPAILFFHPLPSCPALNDQFGPGNSLIEIEWAHDQNGVAFWVAHWKVKRFSHLKFCLSLRLFGVCVCWLSALQSSFQMTSAVVRLAASNSTSCVHRKRNPSWLLRKTMTTLPATPASQDLAPQMMRPSWINLEVAMQMAHFQRLSPTADILPTPSGAASTKERWRVALPPRQVWAQGVPDALPPVASMAMTTARSNACLVLGVPTYAWAALRVATRIWINALAFQLPRCPSADCHRFPRCLLFLTMMRKDTETQLSGQNERKLSNASCALVIWPSCQCRTQQQCSKNAKKRIDILYWFLITDAQNQRSLSICPQPPSSSHSLHAACSVQVVWSHWTRDLAATRQEEMHPERKFRSKILFCAWNYVTAVRYLYSTFLPQLGRSSVYWYRYIDLFGYWRSQTTDSNHFAFQAK